MGWGNILRSSRPATFCLALLESKGFKGKRRGLTMSLEDELNELGKELGQAGDAMRQGVQIAGNALYVALVIVVLVILLIAVLSIHYP